jgi:hypothetical protein
MTEFSALTMTGILIGRLFRWNKPFLYQAEYDNALRVLNVGSWYFLHYALEGPNAKEVSIALTKCMNALQVCQALDQRPIKFGSVLPQEQLHLIHKARETEKALRYDLNVLIYGKRSADTGDCGYVSD